MSKSKRKTVSKAVQTSEIPTESNMQNLGYPKRYTGGNGKTGNNSLTIEKYNEIWTIYQRDQSIAAVARASCVSYHTARRYIQVGDIKRGLIPLAKRLCDIQAETVEVERSTMADEVARSLAITDKLGKYIESQLGFELARLAFDDAGNVIGQYVRDRRGNFRKDPNGELMVVPITKITNDPIAAFNTLERLRLRLMGEPDVRVAEDEYTGYTEEELRVLIKTGQKPTRLAGRAIHSKAASQD